MKNKLLFDFTVDKTNNTILVNREFVADLSLVWDAFTKQEILDQWWAPKPWVSKTKHMNFKVGGNRFYAMISPEGQEHWSIQEYTTISKKTNFKYFESFADKDEKINSELPSANWELNLIEHNGTTTVKIIVQHKTLADIEQIIQMGFKEGLTMTLNDLEILLQHIKK